MSDGESHIVISFASTRTTDGTDVAALVRAADPDAEIEAVLDGDGAVSSYRWTVGFTDGDRAADAAFRIRDELVAMGVPVEFP